MCVRVCVNSQNKFLKFLDIIFSSKFYQACALTCVIDMCVCVYAIPKVPTFYILNKSFHSSITIIFNVKILMENFQYSI